MCEWRALTRSVIPNRVTIARAIFVATSKSEEAPKEEGGGKEVRANEKIGGRKRKKDKRKEIEKRQTDRLTDGQTDRQTDRWMDRQTDG